MRGTIRKEFAWRLVEDILHESWGPLTLTELRRRVLQQRRLSERQLYRALRENQRIRRVATGAYEYCGPIFPEHTSDDRTRVLPLDVGPALLGEMLDDMMTLVGRQAGCLMWTATRSCYVFEGRKENPV